MTLIIKAPSLQILSITTLSIWHWQHHTQHNTLKITTLSITAKIFSGMYQFSIFCWVFFVAQHIYSMDIYHIRPSKTWKHKTAFKPSPLRISIRPWTLNLMGLEPGVTVTAGNTKGGSITVPLTSCLSGLESTVWPLKFFYYLQNRLIQTSQTGG